MSWTTIPLPRGSNLTDFSRDDAHRLARTLRHYVGKRVLLYGGGGFPGLEVRLLGVRVKCETSAKVCAVVPTLKGPRAKMPAGKATFSPFLGSWQLAVKG